MGDVINTRYAFYISEHETKCFPKVSEYFAYGKRGKYRLMLAVMEKYLDSLTRIPLQSNDYEVYEKDLAGCEIVKIPRAMNPNSLANLDLSSRRQGKSKAKTTSKGKNIPKAFTEIKNPIAQPITNSPTKISGSNSDLGDISKALGVDLSGFGL